MKRKFEHTLELPKNHNKPNDNDNGEKKVYTYGNHIWFNDGISNKSVTALNKIIYNHNHHYEKKKRELIYLDIKPKDLYLHINSDGGELSETFAAIDVILNSKIPINTIIEGRAASGATLMSIVGKKRYITKNSILLIHELTSKMWGKMSQLEDEHENNKFMMDKIIDLYTTYTTLTKPELSEMLKHDLWWDATKALKHKLVDDIYENQAVEYF